MAGHLSADTGGAPSARHDPKWLRLAPPNSPAPPLFVWGRAAGEDSRDIAIARAAAWCPTAYQWVSSVK